MSVPEPQQTIPHQAVIKAQKTKDRGRRQILPCKWLFFGVNVRAPPRQSLGENGDEEAEPPAHPVSGAGDAHCTGWRPGRQARGRAECT